MLRCQQCGFENRDTDKFCSQCGAPLPAEEQAPATGEAGTTADPPTPVETPSFMPPPVTPSFSSGQRQDPPAASPRAASVPEPTTFDFGRASEPTEDPSDPDWRMSSLGPPPPPKRRLWLWIVIGLIALCVIVCLGLFFWLGFTDSGKEFVDNIEATATAQAS